MKRLRLAVIGVGHLGRIHARLAREFPGWQLCGVVDPQPQARQAVQDELGVPAYPDLSALSDPIDAAIVATPSATHYAVASQLLQRGAHLLVEKPLTLNVADAQQLIRQAEQAKRVLHVGHVERFNPALVAVRTHLPRPTLILAQRVGAYTGRSLDVGVVLDLMIHDLDIVLTLMGDDRIVGVQVTGAAVVGPNEDWAQVQLAFASGGVAHLFASRVGWRPRRSMEIFSPQVLAEIDFASRKTWLARPDRPPLRLGAEESPASLATPPAPGSFADEVLHLEELTIPQCNPLLEEQRQFYLAISEGASQGVSGQEALQAIDLAEKILAALAVQRLRLQDQTVTDSGILQSPMPLGLSVLGGPHWGRRAVHRKAG
jgi:predicted dehydrogenase